MERRLAAILAADVAGYSRLMEADEEGTARTLSSCREVVERLVAGHHGRVFGSAGDSFIAEFASPVEAVRCAVDIQGELETLKVELPEDRRMRLRIGVNLGDVMVEGDNLLGDGVNIAARLETLAEPGGIALARSVFDQVKKQLDLGYEYLGEHEVRNIAEPVHVYRVLTAPEAAGKVTGEGRRARHSWKRRSVAAVVVVLIGLVGAVAWLRPWEPTIEPASVERMAFPLPDKPSIVVLPFMSMSDDPSQEYFADGMTEDLITDLSKVASLFVIARNSSFVYRGKVVEIRKVAEDLGVRYVLEGSVRRSGDQVRVNAQLIDATTGGHLWADRYDGSVTDVFEVQDLVVREIVSALALSLSDGEQQELVSGKTSNVQAREAFQKGWERYLRYSAEDNAKAADHLKQAVELDPDYGRAYAALGLVYVRGCQWRWHEELGTTPGSAFDTAMAFLTKGESNSSSLTNVAMSQLSLYDGEHDTAFTEAARAIALDPNDPEAQVAMGLAMITTGRPEAGLEFVETALRLSPSHPNHYILAQALAFFAMNDMARAAEALDTALERDPSAVDLAPLLAASYAHLGRREDARAALLKWRPEASQSQLEQIVFTYHFPYKWARSERATRDRLKDGLYIASLPPELTVETLAEQLLSDNGFARRSAARDLGRLGPAAAAAVPALIEALDDDLPIVRNDALISLGKIGPAAKAAIPILTAMLDEGSDDYLVKQALKGIRGF
jgi:TolB-like protein/class 3 adenylate cyclase/thioredoxin-like negative regulator of GroEL